MSDEPEKPEERPPAALDVEAVPEGPEVMTVAEAAAFLKIGRNALYGAIGRNKIPHRRIGRQIRLSRTALVRWLDAEVPDWSDRSKTRTHLRPVVSTTNDRSGRG